MVSVLSKLLGFQQLDAAHDIVQDTLLQAMNTWGYGGLPDNPSAWLYRVARNKAIDLIRREKKFREIAPQYGYLLQSEYTFTPTVNSLFLENEIQDSQLRMIFACCHPQITTESQIALALKTLCGLSVAEIARAFLTSEDTIAKRMYRAKEKIKTEKIELELPSPNSLSQRLDAVLQCLYLLFNEGYNSSHPDELIREELCEEAMRLAYLLTTQTLTNVPKTQALLALFCFQSSRLRARTDDRGNIILLKHQDRNNWYRPLMNRGFAYMEQSISGVFENSPYHLEAAIASLHASASSFEETDWKGIYNLYWHLYELNPSPVIALNKTIAFAYAFDRQSALEQMLAIKGLEHYYIYHTSVGELYHELGKEEEAKEHFKKAIGLTNSKKEVQLLQGKIDGCG